jgi:hypothetical protein
MHSRDSFGQIQQSKFLKDMKDVRMDPIVYRSLLKDKLTSLLNVENHLTLMVEPMPFRITMLLEKIGDGKWHKLDQLKRLMGFSDYELQEITKFLSQYDLAEFDEDTRRVRINRDFQKILANSMI